MSSICKTASGKWRAELCVKGHREKRSFDNKRDAIVWADEREKELKNGVACPSDFTFGDMLQEYLTEIIPTHRGARHDSVRIKKYQRDPIASIPLRDLKHQHMQALIDKLAVTPSEVTGRPLEPSSIRRDFNIFSAALNWAIYTKGYIERSPAAKLRFPKGPLHRERVPSEEEIRMILDVSRYEVGKVPEDDYQFTAAAFLFACRTGMRSGEILKMERSWIEGNVVHIPAAAIKTYAGRDVAMSRAAKAVLDDVLAAGREPAIFGMSDGVRATTFGRIKKACDLGDKFDSTGKLIETGLHFHDTRAYFCTWAASPGRNGQPRLNVMTLAKQLGTHDVKMLMRYYRPSAKQVVEILNEEIHSS